MSVTGSALETRPDTADPPRAATAHERRRNGGAERNNQRMLWLLAAVLVAGCAIRMIGLAGSALDADELIHYYVGESLLRGAGPLLPSGEWYGRGLGTSWLVGWLNLHVHSAELAARLPGALFGVLGLLLFAAAVWRLTSGGAAVAATLLLAIDPLVVDAARSGRFYGMQHCLGIIALVAGYRAILPSLSPRTMPGVLWRQWGWALATLAAFGAALMIQVTTFSTLLAWATIVAAAAALDVRAHGRLAWRRSVPLQLVLAGTLALGAFLVLAPGLLQDVAIRARSVPYWGRSRTATSATPLAYVFWLWESTPVLLSLAPLAFVGAALRNRPLAAYLLAWFAIPFVVLSLLPLRAPRYLLMAEPALCLAAGIAAAAGVRALYGRLRAFVVADSGSWSRLGLAVGLVATVAGAAVMPTAYLAVRRVVAESSGFGQPDWRSAAVVAGSPELARLPLGAPHPLPALFYLGRADFATRITLRERWLGPARTGHSGNGYGFLPIGSPDLYAGVPVLDSPSLIRERFAGRGAVLIAIPAAQLHWEGMDRELRRVLEKEGEDLCDGRCGTLRLYRWRVD